MIIWLDGTFGVGKTTTSELAAQAQSQTTMIVTTRPLFSPGSRLAGYGVAAGKFAMGQ